MFEIGMNVVCKDTCGNHNGYPIGLVKDKTYTILAISYCDCGVELLHLNGVESITKKCNHCGCKVGGISYSSHRFEPLQYKLLSNYHFISEIISEQLDITVKEKILQ